MSTLKQTLYLILITGFLIAEVTPKIEGHVVDSNGQPLSNVHVTLTPTFRTIYTSADGHFLFENIPHGTYSLRFQHIGFKTRIEEKIEVSNEETKLGSIMLEYKVLDLKDVIVTATRSQRSIYEVPDPVNIVFQRQIKERNARTSAEALREETGIFIQKTNHGGGSAIIRGLSSNQILILVDGIRLNNSTYRLGNHQYLTTVDNQMVSRIEVVRGPTSVLYGSDAIGGTINLITKRPVPGSSRLQFHYATFGRYASADQEKTTRAEATVTTNRFAFQAAFSFKDFSDLQRGKNSDHPQIEKSTNGLTQTPSGFGAYDFDSKLAVNLASSQNLILAYQRSRQEDVPRYDKYENNGYHKWLYQPQDRDLWYIVYENNLHSKYFNSFRASFSLHRQVEGREIQKNASSLLIKEKDDVRTTGLTIQVNSDFGNHRLLLGSEVYSDNVYSKRFTFENEMRQKRKEMRGRYPDGAIYTSLGLFVQDEIRFSPKWTVRAGIRFSYYVAEFTIPEDSGNVPVKGQFSPTFQSLTGGFGSIYSLNDYIFLNVNLGQAFRAPNLSDMAKFGESKGDTYEIPNTELKPEEVTNIDFGVKLNFQRLRASATTYYSLISHLLESAETTYKGSPIIEINGQVFKVKTKKNIGRAFIQGVEAEISADLFQDITVRSNVTTTYGNNIINNEPVGGIPPTYGLIGLKWKVKRSFFDLYLRFAQKQDRLSSDDKDDPRIPERGTPGWYTVNGRWGLRLVKNIRVQFAIENLFDVNYREHGSGINGPGRNFILSLQMKN